MKLHQECTDVVFCVSYADFVMFFSFWIVKNELE
jgi:hypothetical protein